MLQLNTPIEYIKGVGPSRAELFKTELNIFTAEDLLNHMPYRYIDRTSFYKLNKLDPNMSQVQVIAKVKSVRVVGTGRGKRLVAVCFDDTSSIELVWFKGIKWVKQSLKPGVDYVIFGKPTLFSGSINMAHPDIEPLSQANQQTRQALQPVYSTTEKCTAKGLHSKGIEKILRGALPELIARLAENLPEELYEHYRLMARQEAYKQIHFPVDQAYMQAARYRLKFEELFFLQLRILRLKLKKTQETPGFVFPKVGAYFNAFYEQHIPFELTGAQKRVVKEIRGDLKRGLQMNRLLQGDVGSGKTMVAVLTMLLAIDNGFQAALMAPTEILANQHYEGVKELLEPLGLRVDRLTGSVKQSVRKGLLEDLLEGRIHVLIGTHALLEDKVKFANLGLVVIDEQHRFGVAQRSKMWKKNVNPPHVLVMSATPIPRTLAMTLYGDLDVSVIDELPPGRKPIETKHLRDTARLKLFEFMRQQIALGRQVYVVYPLIQESETMDYKDLMDGFESITRAFPLPDYRVAIVHGKMKPEDKDHEMELFVSGKAQIMVATTVIEVGVNVPNASVMIIESAERFGLSQLHQLRGRVGRGAEQSYCLLVTGNKLSSDALERMDTMVRTTDGFEVAEADLRLRGPGDLTGTKQSGIVNLKLADLAKDGQIISLARNAAEDVLKKSPDLSEKGLEETRAFYIRMVKNRPDWSKIS